MDDFAELTGRTYKLFDYHGSEDATDVIVIMGSGAETVTADSGLSGVERAAGWAL